MAEDTKKELMEVGVIVPFTSFTGDRVDTDKRCYAGTESVATGKKDKDGKTIFKTVAVKTENKVRIRLPIPKTDADSQKFFKVNLDVLIGMGVRQNAYTMNKSDAYLSTIGTKDIDTKGLTELAELDIPIVEREKKSSVVKEKAAKLDALSSKYNKSVDEIEAILVHAAAKKK